MADFDNVHDVLFPELLNMAINAFLASRRAIREAMSSPSDAKERMLISAPGVEPKEMLYVDKLAENRCREYLVAALSTNAAGRGNFLLLGEESLWKLPTLDLTKESVDLSTDPITILPKAEKRLVAIVDMVDGTDLLERELENWCSAGVFFDPQVPKILFAIVHDSRDRIYVADDSGAYLLEPTHSYTSDGLLKALYDRPRAKLHGPAPVSSNDAAICFYAQKHGHLTTVPSGFLHWPKTKPDRLRIYTLAGNPMMVRLANGERIHAVFEHIGQHPHDAVPGAYIALKAGAYLVNIDTGAELDEADLAAFLLRPSRKQIDGLRYVLASTPDLAHELAVALATKESTCFRCVVCNYGRPGTADDVFPCPSCGVKMEAQELRCCG